MTMKVNELRELGAATIERTGASFLAQEDAADEHPLEQRQVDQRFELWVVVIIIIARACSRQS